MLPLGAKQGKRGNPVTKILNKGHAHKKRGNAAAMGIAESVCQEESCPDIPRGGQAGGQRAKAHGDGSALCVKNWKKLHVWPG